MGGGGGGEKCVHNVCVSACARVCVYARACMCVRVRERETERERVLPLEWVPVYRYT